ncbi:hypothetical protein [Phaeobacter sp. C3_T13_0]
MIFSVAEVVSHLSLLMTLYPGDVLPPEFLQTLAWGRSPC